MRSIDYGPPPIERDFDTYKSIFSDYEISCDEYPGIWTAIQYLDNIPTCDRSTPMDDVYFSNGIIQSHWIIFVTCRPRDAEALEYVFRRFIPKYYISIRNCDSEGDYGI